MFSAIVAPLLLVAAAPAHATKKADEPYGNDGDDSGEMPPGGAEVMGEMGEAPMRGFYSGGGRRDNAPPEDAEVMGETGEAPMRGSYGRRGVDGEVSAGGTGGTMCEGTQTYKLRYDMVWNGRSHPIEYPTGMAMFTPMNTITHNADVSLWAFGEVANRGVVLVAEGGDNSGVEEMAEECIADSTCGAFIQPECMPVREPGPRGVCVAEEYIEVAPEYPYVSSVSMVFPSPDWFTGVSMVNLCKDGRWVDLLDYPLWPLDAGSDSGLTFLSPDLDTQPRAPITNFADIMPSVLGHFYNPIEGRTLPVGTLYLIRE